MGGVIGAQPSMLPLSLSPATIQNVMGAARWADLLRLAQPLQGTVQSSAGNLALHVAGVRVPLDPSVQLQPGQAVTVEVTQSNAGVQVRVTPLPQPIAPQTAAPPVAASSSPGAPLNVMSALIADVLESMGVARPPENALSLAPSQLPPSPAALRQIISLLAEPGTMAEDLRTVATLVRQAVTAGAVPPAEAEHVEALAARLSSSASPTPSQLHNAAQQARGATEARIATALTSGGVESITPQIADDARIQLARIMDNGPLSRYLQDTGQQQALGDAVGRLQSRILGAQLQNLHSLAQPYSYLDIPFVANTPIGHARVHFLGDSSSENQKLGNQNATVVFDLSTSVLGDLWVTLNVSPGRCDCWFRATQPDAVDAIANRGGELAQRLQEAGYPGAQVHAALWDGDHLKATADLLRSVGGVDVSA